MIVCCGWGTKKTIVTTEFPYGSGEDQVYLPVTVTVYTCIDCGREFLDSEAEDIKDAAVKKHLESLGE